MKRNFLSQKLLIPSALEEYDKVVFLDLDVVISTSCPSLFDLLPDEKGLAAVCDPTESDKFKAHYKIYYPSVLSETIKSYFTVRNFPFVTNLQGQINGGILVFNPSKIGKLLKDYYFSDHSQGKYEIHEEAPMAYISQSNNLFVSLPENFNRQFFYELYTPLGRELLKIKSLFIYKVINNVLQKIFKLPYDILLTRKLQNLKSRLIKEDGVFILHFSGKSLPKLYIENLFLN